MIGQVQPRLRTYKSDAKAVEMHDAALGLRPKARSSAEE
jgi:hypothetical protein